MRRADRQRAPSCLLSSSVRRDALETCGELTGMGRESCFAQFGCSSARVTTYFAAVEAMERAFEREGESAVIVLSHRNTLFVCSKLLNKLHFVSYTQMTALQQVVRPAQACWPGAQKKATRMTTCLTRTSTSCPTRSASSGAPERPGPAL